MKTLLVSTVLLLASLARADLIDNLDESSTATATLPFVDQNGDPVGVTRASYILRSSVPTTPPRVKVVLQGAVVSPGTSLSVDWPIAATMRSVDAKPGTLMELIYDVTWEWGAGKQATGEWVVPLRVHRFAPPALATLTPTITPTRTVTPTATQAPTP